jgi:two-component system, LytTR family, response regulator
MAQALAYAEPDHEAIASLPITFLPDDMEKKPIERLVVKSGGHLHLLKAVELDWIRAAGNYVELHTGPKAHLLRTTMNRLEAGLDPGQFIRIHRSVIVNIERIKELLPWYSGDYRLVLRDGTQLTLSRTHRKGFETLVGNLLSARRPRPHNRP